MNPRLSILIVNWNVSDLLDACLGSIEKYTIVPHEVIVVDNDSSDDSVEMVKKKYPHVTVIASPKNIGFVAGNNLALSKASKNTEILYLNPDIELIEDAIGPMLSYLDSNPQSGVIGCELLNTDRSHQQTIGHFTQLSNLWREYFKREKANHINVSTYSKPTPVEVVLGACLLCRSTILRELGGMDPRYFMYLEETDLCKSMKEKGFDTIYYPYTKMIHHSGKSSGYNEESRQRALFENRRSQYLFFQKHHSYPVALGAKALISLGMLIRIFPLVILWLVKPKKRSVQILKLHYYLKTVGWLIFQIP